MDEIDLKILRLLQEDASISIADLSTRVGLSSTPCWRRIRKLEEDGVIQRRVTLLDGKKLNLNTTVFVSIRTVHHNAEWAEQFSRVISDFSEVVEFYRLAGKADYLLKIVVPDIAAFDAFYQRLITCVELHDVTSMFSMEDIKVTHSLPLKYTK